MLMGIRPKCALSWSGIIQHSHNADPYTLQTKRVSNRSIVLVDWLVCMLFYVSPTNQADLAEGHVYT